MIERRSPKIEFGYIEGETCNRFRCDGVIEERPLEGCTCHLGHPPCGTCTTPRGYCVKCDWDAKEEDAMLQPRYPATRKLFDGDPGALCPCRIIIQNKGLSSSGFACWATGSRCIPVEECAGRRAAFRFRRKVNDNV